jgi:Tfp pilus assembly protein PilF
MYYFFRQFATIVFLQAGLFGIVCGQAQNAALNARSTEQMVAEAAKALENNNLIGAKTILQKALKTAPNEALLHTLAGIVADRENDLPAAERHFSLAARLQPKSPETRNNYGAILLKLNRSKEAAREFAASLALNPGQPSALVNLAQIRFAENDFQSARELFEKANAIQPDAEIARALLIISLRINDFERAKKDFQPYFALAKNEENKFRRKELGELLLQAGLAAEAASELAAASALDPSDVELLVLQSRAFLRQNDVRSAGRLLESAVARGADEGKIYAALADVYKAGGYFENAIPAMLRAIEKEPENEFFRAQYGLLLIDSRAPAAAVIRLKESVEKFPNSARLWLALGIAQQVEGKMTEALQSFERSLKIDSKSVPAMSYLASSFIEKAQYSEAVKLYRRALAQEEKNAILHYLLADTLLKIPETEAAVIQKHLERAVHLDPKFAQAHLTLGKFYTRSENWQKALNAFEQALRYEPNVAEIHYQMGRTLARLKRAEESKKAFEKYKKLNETQAAQKETDRQELVRRLANVLF